jgi:hypothetical protein
MHISISFGKKKEVPDVPKVPTLQEQFDQLLGGMFSLAGLPTPDLDLCQYERDYLSQIIPEVRKFVAVTNLNLKRAREAERVSAGLIKAKNFGLEQQVKAEEELKKFRKNCEDLGL